MNLNWTRFLIRAATAFVVLFVLAYVVPGFSGLTIGLLLAVSLLTALVSCLVEMGVKPDSARVRSIILFLTAAVVVYVFSMSAQNVRPPVFSTLLVAALIALVDLVYPEKRQAKGEGMEETGLGPQEES